MDKKNSWMFPITSKRGVFIAFADMGLVACSYVFSILLCQYNGITLASFADAVMALPILLAINLVVAGCGFNIYKAIWRYATTKKYIQLTLSSLIAALLFSFVLYYGFHPIFEFRLCIITALFMVTLTLMSRSLYALSKSSTSDKASDVIKKRAMIIGAGQTAKVILEELTRKISIYKPVCIVDDSPEKIGRTIGDIPVVDKIDSLSKVAKVYRVDTIICAIPSLTSERRAEILNKCMDTGCNVKALPYVSEMIDNVEVSSQMVDIKIEDLLGRSSIKFDTADVAKYINGKVCMITGGGGSIGSELCRQIVKFAPKSVVVVDIYENSSYDIQQEIRRNHPECNFNVEITSVTDYDKMEQLFKQYKPNIVFHAAAHKHVPLMETNPEEAVKNNVFGTWNVTKLADKYKVGKFIMISTDKAVNPTNVMGATKRCCEMIVEYRSKHTKTTEFAAVRFGNVLGSNGSVIPLFKNQIAKGGPVTVTDPEIIRYFMTIPEAVSLVLQAGAFANGGEIFVLDMGKPVKIVTLAENLIKMMGYRPYKDIEIKFTGLRPGEKLFEELLMSEEGLLKTDNNKIFIGKQCNFEDEWLLNNLDKLRALADSNQKKELVEFMKKAVPTFKPTKEWTVDELESEAEKRLAEQVSSKNRNPEEDAAIDPDVLASELVDIEALNIKVDDNPASIPSPLSDDAEDFAEKTEATDADEAIGKEPITKGKTQKEELNKIKNKSKASEAAKTSLATKEG